MFLIINVSYFNVENTPSPSFLMEKEGNRKQQHNKNEFRIKERNDLNMRKKKSAEDKKGNKREETYATHKHKPPLERKLNRLNAIKI